MNFSLPTTSSPKFPNTNKKKGFSLIEVLVSLSIFTVVVTISVGSLMVLVEANSRSRSTHTAMTNLSFALDSMTREIRTGTDYRCINNPTFVTTVSDCVSSRSGFSFIEGGQSLTAGKGSRQIAYRLNNNAIQRRLGNAALGTGWMSITDPNVNITTLDFYMQGSSPMSASAGSPDIVTPVVTIYIEGYVTSRGSAETFAIQTSVEQELLDI